MVLCKVLCHHIKKEKDEDARPKVTKGQHFKHLPFVEASKSLKVDATQVKQLYYSVHNTDSKSISKQLLGSENILHARSSIFLSPLPSPKIVPSQPIINATILKTVSSCNDLAGQPEETAPTLLLSPPQANPPGFSLCRSLDASKTKNFPKFFLWEKNRDKATKRPFSKRLHLAILTLMILLLYVLMVGITNTSTVHQHLLAIRLRNALVVPLSTLYVSLLYVSQTINSWLSIPLSLPYCAASPNDALVDDWDEFSMTADEKIQMLWQKVSSDTSPVAWPSLLEQLLRIFLLQTDDLSRITYQQTFRPWGARKIIHTQSAYGQFLWKPVPVPNHKPHYTGLLAEEVQGILSFSKAPNQILGNFTGQFGIGFRMYRDYALPAGFVTMFPAPLFKTLTHYGAQWNMFGNGVACTHVSVVAGMLLSLGNRRRPKYTLYEQYFVKFPNSSGLMNLANKTKDGRDVAQPHVPFAICFLSNDEVASNFTNATPWTHPVEQLKAIEPGTKLFDVVAIDHPRDLLLFHKIGKEAFQIAEVFATSKFTSSGWGDQWLHTQHQNFQADVLSRPDWKPFLYAMAFDGLPYVALQPLLAPSVEQIFTTFEQSLSAIKQLLEDPVERKRFFEDSVGFGNLTQIYENINNAAYYSPNPGLINRQSRPKTIFWGLDIPQRSFRSIESENNSKPVFMDTGGPDLSESLYLLSYLATYFSEYIPLVEANTRFYDTHKRTDIPSTVRILDTHTEVDSQRSPFTFKSPLSGVVYSAIAKLNGILKDTLHSGLPQNELYGMAAESVKMYINGHYCNEI